MFKMNGFIATLFAVLAVPALGQADDIRVSSYEMSETGGTVLLESTAAIGEPWMRIDGKSVRIWFPRFTHVARFDHARDAEDPIRALNLRPGADDSAVLRLDLGSARKLSRDDIEVVRTGTTARVHISFDAPTRPAPQASPVPAPVPAPEPARPLPQLSAAGKVSPGPTTSKTKSPGAGLFPSAPPAQAAPTPSQDAASSPSARAAADAPAPAAVGGSAIRSLARAADGKDATMQLGLASGSSTNLGGLLLLSGILCAVYLGIRHYGKKRATRTPDIQVISARRLGHRSEMLVVRALGADHLLVTSAGRVERVASVPTPVEPEPQPEPPLAAPAPAAPSAAAEASSQVSGLGIISHLSSSYRVRRLLDTVDKEAPEALPAEESAPNRRPSFGPELLSAMSQHKLANLSALPPLANKQSEAVAGIARLRAGTGSRSAN